MTVRPVNICPETGRITIEDAAIVSAFYQNRGAPGPSRETLPSHGFIAENKPGEPTACAFCYLDGTGSGVAMLAWVASDPASTNRIRGMATRSAIEAAIISAYSLNYWQIMASFNTPSLIRILKQRGFKAGDTKATHLHITFTT